MNAYRLERFSPAIPSGPTPSMIERRIDAVREESYRLGFLAGQAAANEAFLDEQGRLTGDLVEAIADARLTNEAARRHVAASIGPMIAALAAGIAPALAEAGLGAEVTRIVERALAAGARRAAAAALRPGGRGAAVGAARRARARRHRRGGPGAPAARGADLLGPGLRPSRSRRLRGADARLHRVASGTQRNGRGR